jgi:hypothetical protein
MSPQPLLLDRPLPAQLALAIVLPAAFGALCGVMLGVSAGVYTVLSLLGVLGGLLGGYDHDGAGEGALRGIAGGLLFGVFILAAHSVAGTQAKADLPHPHAVLPVVTTVLGVVLHAIGGALRGRREARSRAAVA